MDYSIETAPLEKLQCDCLIVGVYQDLQLSPTAAALDETTQELIGKIIRRGDISGKIAETLLLHTVPDSPIERVLLVGLGENKPLTNKDFIKALAAAASNLKKPYLKSVLVSLAECAVAGNDMAWKTRQIVETVSDAVYQYTHTKSDKETESKLEKVVIMVSEAEQELANMGLNKGWRLQVELPKPSGWRTCPAISAPQVSWQSRLLF